jgi:hypothetical protein
MAADYSGSVFQVKGNASDPAGREAGARRLHNWACLSASGGPAQAGTAMREATHIAHDTIHAGVTFFDNAWQYHHGRAESGWARSCAAAATAFSSWPRPAPEPGGLPSPEELPM